MTVFYTDRYFATIAYADIFNFSLTQKEARYWMIGVSRVQTIKADIYLKKRIGREVFITFKGRQRLIDQRMARRIVAKSKLEKAKRVASWYAWIPTVLLVGVTGGLAMENAKPEDDIDLFFVTSADTMWMTRLLVTLISQMKGVRRLPDSESVADSICLNMFMAAPSLTLATSEQDLFAAHEVLQMVPLWQRGGVYRKFLSANSWVRFYLPNAWADKLRKSRGIAEYPLGDHIACWWFRLFESTAKVLQVWYMKKRRTTEVIERGVLRFHPKDARLWVKKKYELRLKKANLPLDRIFYRG